MDEGTEDVIRILLASLLVLLPGGCNAVGSESSTPSVSSTPSTSTPSTSRPATTPSLSQSATPTKATVTESPCTVPSRFKGLDVERMPVAGKLIALTFDAGANADGVPSILRTLAARSVPATFFLTGQFVRTFPQRSARIAALHLVGNHTQTHPDLTTLTDEQIVAEVRRAQRAIIEVTGEDPRRFFRFPFGARTPHEIALLNRLCYVPFRWTVDTLVWEGILGGQSVESVVSRVMSAAAPGAIVLMHVGSHPQDHSTLDADALPRIIGKLRAAGYRFVPLSRVLSPEP